MEMKVGAPFTFTWRNDELNTPPSKRPEISRRAQPESRITEPDRRVLCHRLGQQWRRFLSWPKGGSKALLTPSTPPA
jgi:hypothetical protein